MDQGEEVEEGKVLSSDCMCTVEVGFRDSGMRFFSTDLYYCEEPKPPQRKTKGKQTTVGAMGSHLGGRARNFTNLF